MTTEFIVDTTVDGEWFRAIATVLRGRVESDRDEVTTWLDTHDWRLHDAGLVLTHHRSAHQAWWSLHDEGEGVALARLPAAPEPGGLDSVPEGAVRERLAAAEATVHELAHRAAGLTPRTHRSSPDVEVAPGKPAGELWAAMLGQLLEILEDNLEGTLRRWDTEFLHDPRVAVRRSRSVVKFGAGVLRDDVRDHLATELRWLGAQTSLPRDLEEALRSVRFDHLVQVWRRDPTGAKGADRPVEEVAGELLATATRKVRRRGRALTPDSRAEALHDLRKRAKELRYLLDMFVGLDRDGTTHRVQSATKTLQKALGRHQDAVAQSHLAERTTTARADVARGWTRLDHHLDEGTWHR